MCNASIRRRAGSRRLRRRTATSDPYMPRMAAAKRNGRASIPRVKVGY